MSPVCLPCNFNYLLLYLDPWVLHISNSGAGVAVRAEPELLKHEQQSATAALNLAAVCRTKKRGSRRWSVSLPNRAADE